MFPSCVLLVIPALLLSGCDKEKEETREEAFQAYVKENKLYGMLEDEYRKDLLTGVKAAPGPLEGMIKEAAAVTLYSVSDLMNVPSVFNLDLADKYLKGQSDLEPLYSGFEQHRCCDLRHLLVLVVEEYHSRLSSARELQLGDTELHQIFKKFLNNISLNPQQVVQSVREAQDRALTFEETVRAFDRRVAAAKTRGNPRGSAEEDPGLNGNGHPTLR